MDSNNPLLLLIRAAVKRCAPSFVFKYLIDELDVGHKGYWESGLEALVVCVKPLWKEL